MPGLSETSRLEGFVPFTVSDFYEAGKARFQFEILAGQKAMSNKIVEPVLNRPGLALTGFYTDFEPGRVQVIGNAEASYLSSLDEDIRFCRVRDFLFRRPSLVVFTGGHCPVPRALRIADELGVPILSTKLGSRMFMYHSLALFDKLASPRTKIYGTMMEVCGLGVLFEGAPGLGKSETALGLMRRGHALIADDLTCIRKDSALEKLFGSASASTAGYMEIRGIGIIHVPSIFGVDAVRGEKRLDLVITFRPLSEIRDEVDRIGQKRAPKEILGVKVPNILLPVSEGRDMVNLVETAAQQHKLIRAGADPASQLSIRLRNLADHTKHKHDFNI